MASARPMTRPAGRLRGVRVLVTRPAAAAGRLADAFVAEGADAVCVPAIVIAPVEDGRSMERLRERLSEVSVAVFTSVNAVDGYFEPAAVGETAPAAARLPPVVLAVGRATADALRARGATDVGTPSERFDSEGLLACPQLAAPQVVGRRVTVVKGEGGRNLLAAELVRRGAEVIEANVYRRGAPERLASMLEGVRESVDVVTATSAEALENLLDAAPWIAGWLSRRLLVTVSERVAEVARSRNLARVVVSGGADATSIVEATVRAVAGSADTRASTRERDRRSAARVR